MYLTRAECNVRAGNTTLAADDINLIRQRSYVSSKVPAVPYEPVPTVTLADVLLERQLELAFEGFRIHDLRRTDGIVIPAVAATPDNPASPAVRATADIFVLPIPQREINNNANLKQNAGY